MRGLICCLLVGLVWLAPPVLADSGSDAPGELVRELNDDRRRRGLSPLVEHPALMAAARAQVADMARRGYVSPTAPDGINTTDWLARAGYRATAFAAFAVSGLPTAWETAGAVLESGAMVQMLFAPGEVRIGVGHHEGLVRLRDGRATAFVWSVIAAVGVPPPIVDAAPELLREINRARARLGAGPVKLNDALSRAAGRHADDMIGQSYFAHVSPDGGTLADRVDAVGYDYRKVGENLAAGQMSPAAVVQAWHDSPGHARTMYDRAFDEIGLAYRLGPLPNGARDSPHVWVAVFGSR